VACRQLEPAVLNLAPKSRGQDILLLAGLSAFIFAARALVWPLGPGRDAYTYFYFFFDFFNPQPEDPFTMMMRTPFAPLFNVFLIDGLGPIVAEIFMGIVFVGTILVLFEAALSWGRAVAWLFSLVLLANFSYGSLFHVVSNDPPIAVLFALIFLFSVKAATLHSFRWYMALGVLVGLMQLTRPGVFFVLGILPFLVKGVGFRQRLGRAAVFFLLASPFVLGWSYRNYRQYQSFSFSLGADVALPLGRLLAVDKLVMAENGPHSQKLAAAIEGDILKDPKYRGWTANRYLAEEAHYFTLMQLADRTWGSREYGVLRGASREAMMSHPWAFIKGVGFTFFHTFLGNLKLPVPLVNGAYVHTHKGSVAFVKDGQDQFIKLTEIDPHSVIHDQFQERMFRERGPASLRAYLLERSIPIRDGWIALGRLFNFSSYLFPPILLWLLVGLVGLRWHHWSWNRDLALFLLTSLAMVTNISGCLALWTAVYQYRLPFDPAYLLFGLLGIVGVWNRFSTQKKISLN
jgi:hypothetical protein